MLEPEEEKSDVELLRASIKQPQLFSILVNRYRTPFIKKASYILLDADEA